MLPWWVGVTLALTFYVWLHHVATQPAQIAPTDLKQLGEHATRQIWVSLAMFLQYVIPAACLFGAAASTYARHQRNRLHHQVAMSPSRSALEGMTWREFEKLVGEVFRRKGFVVEERGGNGPDGGVDLVLRLGTDVYLVQCKQWKADRVGVATVRELYGVMAAEHAVGGFVVASGQFTEEAKRFAEGRSIELVGTNTLLALVDETSAAQASEKGRSLGYPPACPSCGAPMATKTAKRGHRSGEVFWSCTRFPACRGVRSA